MNNSDKTQITAIITAAILTAIYISVYYIFGSDILISLSFGFGIGFITAFIIGILGD